MAENTDKSAVNTAGYDAMQGGLRQMIRSSDSGNLHISRCRRDIRIQPAIRAFHKTDWYLAFSDTRIFFQECLHPSFDVLNK